MNIDKIDKIILKETEYERIVDWVDEQKFETIDLPLYEALIIINDIEKYGMKVNMGVYFKFDPITSHITIKEYDMKDMYPMFTGLLTDEFFKNGNIHIKTEERWRKHLGEDHLHNICILSIKMVLNIFQYMSHYSENVVSKAESKSIRKPPKHKSKSTKSRYVKIKTTKYTFDFNPDKEKRSIERHAHAWTVRGHWRYYKKTSKRVWINGYKKGIGDTEGKLYKI